MKLATKLAALATVLGVVMFAGAGSALAWAPEGSATIHPGVMTFTGGSSFVNGAGQCTANFVFTDASGGVYLGQAAHCSSTGGDTDTDGCSTQSLPLGTPIYAGDAVNGGLQDGTKIGTLAYNSWIAMHNAHETDANTCDSQPGVRCNSIASASRCKAVARLTTFVVGVPALSNVPWNQSRECSRCAALSICESFCKSSQTIKVGRCSRLR